MPVSCARARRRRPRLTPHTAALSDLCAALVDALSAHAPDDALPDDVEAFARLPRAAVRAIVALSRAECSKESAHVVTAVATVSAGQHAGLLEKESGVGGI